MRKKRSRFWARSGTLLAAAAAAALLVPAGAGASSTRTPIPNEGPTVLPGYVGHAARAHPIPPPGAPQNPFTAPNPFAFVHQDPWQSDTFTVAGPLGRTPAVLSSTLQGARRHKSGAFVCVNILFDQHGRLEAGCLGPGEASLVLVDPVSLKLLAFRYLPISPSVTSTLGSVYFYLDNHYRLVMATATKHIWVVAETGPAAHPRFTTVADYNLSKVGAGAEDKINAIAPDWRGRIWFVTHAGTIGVFDPAKYPAPDAIHTLQLGNGEQITNGHAMTPTAAYVVTSKKMYRVSAAADGKPHVVWSAPYQTTGQLKPGQYSLGSGTSPTILDHGRYVAIMDNAYRWHMVVYRTAARLGPHERRIVCQVPVFPPGHGATDDSLVGSGRSLIVANNYGYSVNLDTLQSTPSVPGVVRVDINANGNGCHLVWDNRRLENANVAPDLSTRTGLVYLYVRRTDPKTHVDVWYWTAVDFRTGKTVWQRLAGTGRLYDSYYPRMVIGPTGTAYVGQYGGIVAISDTR